MCKTRKEAQITSVFITSDKTTKGKLFARSVVVCSTLHAVSPKLFSNTLAKNVFVQIVFVQSDIEA